MIPDNIPTIKLKDLLLELALIEGLEKTCEINAAITNLNRMWTLKHNIHYEKDGDSIKMSIYDSISIDEFEAIINHIHNFLGYFPAHISSSTGDMGYSHDEAIKLLGRNFIIIFDAKYDEAPIQPNIPDELYHISPSKHDKKISEIGLSPRHKDKMSAHPDRVYLAYTIKSAEGLLTNPEFLLDKDGKRIRYFTVYKINMKELKNIPNMKFYSDPIYANKGIYTYNNIHPKYLSIVRRIDMENKNNN
jgi:hypothetical protein